MNCGHGTREWDKMKITKRQFRKLVREAWLDAEEDDFLQQKLAFLDVQAEVWAELFEASSSSGTKQQIRQGLEDLYDRLFNDIFEGGY